MVVDYGIPSVGLRGGRAWLGPWSVVVFYNGLMIFCAFGMIYLWWAHLCSASNFVHPVEVQDKFTSLIGSSHVLYILDKLWSFFLSLE